MIGFMLERDFMTNKSICGTFVLTKPVCSGSGQMLLNTLTNGAAIAGSQTYGDGFANSECFVG